VALLCNPERKIPENLLTGWADRVGREAGYEHVSQTQEEGVLVSKDGLLQIAWPHLVEGGEPVQFDLVLATANDPTLSATPPSYPNVETITKAWNVAAREHVEYFWKNLDNGIRTFEDNEIRGLLHPRDQAKSLQNWAPPKLRSRRNASGPVAVQFIVNWTRCLMSARVPYS
jgi:hypothetical protein